MTYSDQQGLLPFLNYKIYVIRDNTLLVILLLHSPSAAFQLGSKIWLRVFRSSRPEVFCKKGVLRNFATFTGKHLRQSLFFNKVACLIPATLLKKTLKHRCFPVNFEKFLRTPLVAASEYLVSVSFTVFTILITQIKSILVWLHKRNSNNDPRSIAGALSGSKKRSIYRKVISKKLFWNIFQI